MAPPRDAADMIATVKKGEAAPRREYRAKN
jgi:hypothetical protein